MKNFAPWVAPLMWMVTGLVYFLMGVFKDDWAEASLGMLCFMLAELQEIRLKISSSNTNISPHNISPHNISPHNISPHNISPPIAGGE